MRCVRCAKRSVHSVGTTVPFFLPFSEASLSLSISSAGIGMAPSGAKPLRRKRPGRQ